MKNIGISCFLIGCLLFFATTTNASDWHQAAGPTGSWAVKTKAKAPVNWSVRENKNIAWKIALPEGGQSGICISKGKIFLTVMNPVIKIDKKKDLMSSDILCLCVDEKTGKILWERKLKGSVKSEMMYGFSDSSTPTPVADGNHVWFTNASGGLACYDFQGNKIWTRQWQPTERLDGVHFPFNKQFEPMLSGHLIINMEPAGKGEAGRTFGWNYLFGLNKKTGEVVWISEDSLTHYNTPYANKLKNGIPAVLIGRGGHHGVPEKPRGYSMINLETGKRIWQYNASNGMALYNSVWNEKYAVWMTYDNEIHLLESQTGKLIKKISLSNFIDYRRFDKQTGKYILESGIDFKAKYKRNIFPAWFTNLLIDNQLYFMCFKRGNYNQNVGPEYCIARVNLKNEKVEYLEVPVQFDMINGEKKYIWHQDLKTVTINSRGLDVSHDKRSRRDGWHWNFNGNPIAVNDVAYFTTMGGAVHCLDLKANIWGANALLNLNDLGPKEKTWSVNTPSFANGKFYHRTLKHLICIEEKE